MADRGKDNLYKNSLSVSLSQGCLFEQWCQFFAVWLPDTLDSGKAFKYFCDVYQYFIKELEANGLSLCTKRKQIAGSGMTPLLSVEGGALLGAGDDILEKLRDMGVRMLSLTHNGENFLAGGAHTNGRLKAKGRETIKAMQELGIVLDVSHLSERSFWNAVDHSTGPVAASHSNSAFICPNPRNLTDEQFCAIRDRGGIVGVCFEPSFLRENYKAAIVQDIVTHILHFLELGGEKTVCIGSDFDGIEPMETMSAITDIPSLKNALALAGVPHEVRDDIFFNNARRFFEKIFE